jgi:ribosome-associated translation inhibitor RaiA
MKTKPVVTFRRIRGTEILEADILKRLAKLETYCSSIKTAHVTVEPSGRHHQQGNHFRVRIDLTVPGAEIVVGHEAALRHTARVKEVERVRKGDEPARAHRNAHVAVREAFEAARRRLQDYVRVQRGEVKRKPSGTISPRT